MGQGGLDISQTQFEPAAPYFNIICMTLAAGLIAISLQASARHLLPAMVAGLGGLLAYHLVGWVGLDARLQVVFGATMTGVIGAYIAGRHRIPSLVLAVPGMTFLLPGLSVFRGMYAVTIEAETTGHGVVSLVTAMTTILSMAAGLVPTIGTPASSKRCARPSGVWPPSWTMTPASGPASRSAWTTSSTSSSVSGSK